MQQIFDLNDLFQTVNICKRRISSRMGVHFNVRPQGVSYPHTTKYETRSILSSLAAAAEIGSASAGSLHRPEVRARLESGPRAAAHSPLAEHNGFLQLRLHGYHGSFLMSTLRNLAHFLEDDSASQVLPMEISVRDTHVNLKVGSCLRSPRHRSNTLFN